MFKASPSYSLSELAACNDGKDNDNDGWIDYPRDPGCTSPEDSFETNNIACNDGMDNDNDGYIDYPADATCKSYNDISEGDYSKKNGPDLIVSSIGANRLATFTGFTYGKYYAITVWFKNIGTVPVSHPFSVVVNTPKSGSWSLYYTYIADERLNRKYLPRWGGSWLEGGKVLMPGEEIATSVYWVPLYEGQVYEISAIVDSLSEISEINEDNNKLVRRFVIEIGLGGLENVRAID